MSQIVSYFHKLFRLKLPNQKIRQCPYKCYSEAYDQITKSLNKAFQLPSLKQYASTLSIKGLLNKSVQMFVGSRNVPKNINLSRYLIDVASSRSNNPQQKDQIEYYKYFFIRIDAFKTGKQQEFDMTTQVLNRLADQKQHPQSSYLAGKQILNIAMTTRQIPQKKQMLKLSTIYFQNSLTDSNYGGLYYLGQIYSHQEYSHIQEEEYLQFFHYGAALGDPLCYFKLALIYLQKKEIKLYLFYLKLAAQSGVVQAQHNLGCQYLQGKNMNKDDVKALAWFIHAAANGYIESKFNVAQLFLHGSKCGKIKKNPKVALVKLQELKSAGQIVDQKIRQIIDSNPQIKQIVEQKDHNK